MTERQYDQDTDGDYDENTLDGSEGLDADVITTDNEDLTVDAPETWKPIEENHDLDDKLAAERPDVDSPEPEDEGVSTLAGLVILLAGRIPEKGAKVTTVDGWELEVLDATPKRVRSSGATSTVRFRGS